MIFIGSTTSLDVRVLSKIKTNARKKLYSAQKGTTAEVIVVSKTQANHHFYKITFGQVLEQIKESNFRSDGKVVKMVDCGRLDIFL